MTTEAYEEAVRTATFDTSSDPNFVAYYAAESQTPETRERFTRVRDRALELLADNGRGGTHDVVDIGCGAGTQAMLWAALGHRVRALDVNRALIAIGRDRASRARMAIEFHVGTATALPYETGSADVVLMPELLEHVVEWEQCLEEAVRVLRPGGLLYLSTTNWLCPVQQEFHLPAYSWYPGPLKRLCERRAVTTHPHWVEHARYPAVNWFSYYRLSRWLRERGFSTLDRFDMLARQSLASPARAAIGAVRALPPLRVLAHVASSGTTVWALRNRGMTILYHHRTTAQDGSAVHIEGLTQALRQQGHRVVVVAPAVAAQPAAPHAGVMSAVRKRLPRVVHESLELLYNLPEAVRLVRALWVHRPDVIYERSNLFTISGALLARRFGVPRIAEVNSPFFLERSRYGGIAMKGLARWTEDFAWRRADAVIPVTQELARIVEASGVSTDRIRVMSNGVDIGLIEGSVSISDAKNELGWSDRIVLGFTGFVREWNGLEPVVDLLAFPRNEALALLVVGDGTARRALEERAARLGVQDRVRFTGRLPRADIPRWVSAFDIALQPAANPYASPLKLFEYMALGRAIVAPDQPNIREVLQHERDALLFEPGREGAFAAAVQRLASDPSLRTRLAGAAAATIRQREMTWAENARRVTELAEQLARVGAHLTADAARSISVR